MRPLLRYYYGAASLISPCGHGAAFWLLPESGRNATEGPAQRRLSSHRWWNPACEAHR